MGGTRGNGRVLNMRPVCVTSGVRIRYYHGNFSIGQMCILSHQLQNKLRYDNFLNIAENLWHVGGKNIVLSGIYNCAFLFLVCVFFSFRDRCVLCVIWLIYNSDFLFFPCLHSFQTAKQFSHLCLANWWKTNSMVTGINKKVHSGF